jgi:histidine triad (HIT) family protein
MMAGTCVFCEIAAGRIPAPAVFESDRFLAFLDHRPLFPGHCLLIPREHYSTLSDLPVADTGPMFAHAARLCSAIEEAMGAQGTFVAINNRISQSVPHLHVHIVPRREKDGLRGFFWPRQKYQNDPQVEIIRSNIRSVMDRLNSPPLI